MAGKQFSLHKRGKVYYVEFKDPVTGKFSIVKSSGCKNKSDAENWAIEHVKEFVTIKEGKMVFSEFVKDFWTETGLWYLNRIAESKSTPTGILQDYRRRTEQYLVPFFSKMKLNEISKLTIREFRGELIQRKLSGSYINQLLVCLKYIMIEAEEEGIIPACPQIKNVAAKPKVKGILTQQEVVLLFNHDWESKRAYLANLLAATTGCRMCEVCSIGQSDVDFERGLIHIHKSYNFAHQVQNFKTKSGKPRVVPVSQFVLDKIQELIAENPHESPQYIFYSFKPTQPISSNKIVYSFQQEMQKLGIDYKARNIKFHSWRHRAVSTLIQNGISTIRTQQVIGHASDSMTEHYLHSIEDDSYEDIRKVQNELITLQ